MVFSVSVTNLINLLFIAAGIGVCGLCFLSISFAKHLRKEVRRYFQVFFLMILFYIHAHLARQLMDGIPGEGVRTALYVITFLETLSAGLMTHMMSLLILAAANAEKKAKTYVIVLYALLAAHTAVLVAGCFTGAIYYFDAANTYHRGALYLLSNISPMLMMAVDVVLIVRYRKNIDNLLKSAFWLFIVAPVVAIVFQLLFFGIQFIIFATVAAAVYMFGVIIKLQNDEFQRQQLERTRIESELNLASEIQADMLPNIYPAFPDRPEFDIYATMNPAKEVGGDFYDFFLIDEDHLYMAMADVSGKGVPAALFMMATKIILANNAKSGKSPAEILNETNAAICSNNREEMFVTAWLGVFEISTGRLTAANAGHEYPVIRHADGAFEVLKDKHGLVVGGMSSARYRDYEVMLEPGSKVFLYTDGIPEATDADGNMFGLDRMVGALNINSGAEPEKILGNVQTAVDDFVKTAEQFDDLTMLCMEYRG